jgi:hypothetical protein
MSGDVVGAATLEGTTVAPGVAGVAATRSS